MTAILDEWERRQLKDKRWLAYILATTRREVGMRMQPVREGFAKSDAAARAFVERQGYKYAKVVNDHVYYGRGLVQLTWDFNYRKMGELLRLDLLNNPDLALDPKIAAQILFEGMIRGSFTGRSLSLYFNDELTDWINARRIVNGLDHAGEIAGVAQKFYAALKAAGEIKALQQPTKTSLSAATAGPAKTRSWVDVLLSPFRSTPT